MHKGRRMRVLEKLKQIAEKHPEILVPRDKLEQANGFTLAALENMGFEKRDLIKLEHMRVALRGYSQNVWKPGDIMPNGKVAPGEYSTVEIEKKVPYKDARGYIRHMSAIEDVKVPNMTHRGRGHTPLWIIVL